MEIANSHEHFMRLALSEAWKYQFLTYPNPAVGACIVDKNGAILSIKAHTESGMPHAEVLALKTAYHKLTGDTQILKIIDSTRLHEYLKANHSRLFKECSIYVTLEPCNHYGKTPPCSKLLSDVGIKKVYVGAEERNKSAAGGIELLKKEGVSVESGILVKECEALLEPFFIWQEDSFVLFKWAQRLNGTIDGGYISCHDSLKLVHAIRSKVDMLLIGGNTVRIDRPTLDSRLVNKRAPDIGILSHSSSFDKTIPLFLVPDRDVTVSDDISALLSRRHFVMAEGGSKLLKALSDKISWCMGFISLNNKNGIQIEVPEGLELLHVFRSGNDIGFYARKN